MSLIENTERIAKAVADAKEAYLKSVSDAQGPGIAAMVDAFQDTMGFHHALAAYLQGLPLSDQQAGNLMDLVGKYADIMITSIGAAHGITEDMADVVAETSTNMIKQMQKVAELEMKAASIIVPGA